MEHNPKTKHFYLHGQLYTGEAAFINGYNGYEHPKDDGMFCALLPNGSSPLSCWTKRGKPNKLLDDNSKIYIDQNKRGCIVFVCNGIINWATAYYQ